MEFEPNTIVSFKLVNGEEIIAKVLYETKDAWCVSKPLSVIPVQSGGLKIVSPLITSNFEAETPLPKIQVVMRGPTVEQVADHYRELTTGIKTVKKPGIILG